MAIEFIEQPLPRVEKMPFTVNVWRGLNRLKGGENSGEMVSMKNMSSDNVPFSSPRKPREIVADGIENSQNLFAAGDKIGYIAGGRLYYDGAEVGTVGETSSIVDFNGNVVMYPSNMVFDYEENEFNAISSFLNKAIGFYKRDTGEFSTANEMHNNLGVKTYLGGDQYRAVYTLGEIPTPNNETIIIKGTGYTGEYTSLYIVGIDSNGDVLTNGDTNHYKNVSFGSPIKIDNAVKLRVMVGYSTNKFKADVASRDADLANTNVMFWYSGTVYPSSGVPAIQYACVDNNRIFAAQGNSIYASSQGKYDDWTDFVDADGNPNPLGSYREDLDTPQDITGIVKYKGNVVITKPDLVYESYGNKPPYRIIEVAKTGCIDGRSIVEVNSVLYWLGRKGIYAYTGGQPRIISEKINKTFESGIAGTDGRKYYISAYDGDKWELYVFDTFTGLWHIEDNAEFVGFAYAQGHMHALSAGGTLYKFNSGDERVRWEFETQDFTFGIPNTKTLSKLYVRVQMQANTYLDIYMKKDNGEYEKKASYHARDYTVFDFKAKIKKFDGFAIKFSGIGDVRILDIHGDITVGTAKHRPKDLSVFRG